MVNRVRGRLQYNHVYVCWKCHKREAGTTQSIEVDGHGSQYIKSLLDELQPNSYGMPMHWARTGAYSRSYQCGECNGFGRNG